MSTYKAIIIVVVLLIAHLQYRLWLGDGGIGQIKLYEQKLQDLSLQVKEKKERNEQLYNDVKDLRKGEDAIEERARYELGMIKENETFFQVLE